MGKSDYLPMCLVTLVKLLSCIVPQCAYFIIFILSDILLKGRALVLNGLQVIEACSNSPTCQEPVYDNGGQFNKT